MKRLYAAILATLTLASCSTTRSLTEGQYRLVENKVEFSEGSSLADADITPYIRQSPGKWSPALVVYNWAKPGSDKGLNKFWRKIGTAPVVFNKSLVDGSLDNIRDHLEHLGYYSPELSARVDTVRKTAKVSYVIKPGSRYVIDSVVFHIPEGQFAEEFRADSANVSVRAGDYLSEAALMAESERGAAYFRKLGYYDFSAGNYFFEADTLGSSNILHYSIRGYTRNEPEENDAPIVKYSFGNVSIRHSGKLPFRESILRKVNILSPGQLYDERKVNTNYTRFSTLRVFSGVGIELEPKSDHTLDCVIDLRDSKPQGVKFNIESSINSSSLVGISPQVSYYHKNIFQGAERLNVDFSGNWQFRPGTSVRSTELTGSVGLSFPRFLGLPYSVLKGPYIPRTEITASYGYQNRPEYKRNVAGLSFGYTGQVSDNFYYQFYPLQVNYVFLHELSPDFAEILASNPALASSYLDHLNAGVTTTMYHTTNSDLVPKSPYRYVRLTLDFSGNVLSLFNRILPANASGERMLFNVPYSQFVRAELSLGKTFMWGGDDTRAIAVRLLAGAGYAYGNSASMPFEKQFYAGGASSMRGWQARTLGPGFDKPVETFSIPSQSGDFKMEIDLEYRCKLFDKLEGALFAEAGNVWMYDGMQDFIGSIAADWGLGVRLNLDFILLRFDAGFKLHDPSKEPSQRWLGPDSWFKRGGYALHLGVGYPF